MKKARQLHRLTSFAVACCWTIPVIVFAGYILWSLVPFFQDDDSSTIVWLLRTSSYFCVRAVTGVWAREWSFLPIRFENLSFVEWGLFYLYGLFIDLILASVVIQIGVVATPFLNRASFALAFRMQRSRAQSST